MEQLGQILDKIANQNDSTPALSIKDMVDMPLFVTPEEAQKLGYKLLKPVPEPIQCEFCQSKLKPIGQRKILRAEILVWNKFQECRCVKAIQHREQIRLEEKLKQEREEEVVRRVELQTRTKKLFDQSKLGARFLNRTFDTFKVNNDNRLAFESAKKYAVDFEKYKTEGIGLNFNGAYGTGKTHLAAAITIDLINRGIPVITGTAITLLGKFKETYDRKESESEIIDLYSTIDLLIIDDLGKERVNEWVLEKLYLIINNRYENNLPLVITTNYGIDGLTERLSTNKNIDTAEAIVSRLWEMCRGIEMNFIDWRKAV